MARKSAQVEVRMLGEYLQATYPNYIQIRNVPLGKVDTSLMASAGYQKAIGMSRPYRPEADAVVIAPGALILIEAKVWNVVNGLAKLPLYKSLVPVTPELKDYLSLPVIMELVVGWSNDNLETMASGAGVRIKVFSPAWLADVVNKLHDYWTQDYRTKRDEVLRQRQNLGLE
jgi:hypothetical protein